MTTRMLVTLALGAALALAGCGGGAAATASAGTGTDATNAPEATSGAVATTPPQDGAALDACAMLTTAEVKDVTGKDTTGATESTSGKPDWISGQCWWDDEKLTVRFSLDVGDPASIAKSSSPTAAEQMEIMRLVYKSMDGFADIPGLGDDAVYAGGMVVAVKGGSMLQIAGIGLTKDQAIELAKLAIGRL
ncbi:MAG TPA: hypothetical protein VES19_17285 [Candidatus Limnocylindrales bacterium]|nr:hypothetical protein [Candidatus Limnocylindrales bacterium]